MWMRASLMNLWMRKIKGHGRRRQAKTTRLLIFFFARLFCETEIFICSLDSSRPLQHRQERYCFEVGRWGWLQEMICESVCSPEASHRRGFHNLCVNWFDDSHVWDVIIGMTQCHLRMGYLGGDTHLFRGQSSTRHFWRYYQTLSNIIIAI